MNAHNKRPKLSLALCPRCGMDSGERKVKESTYEQYYVVCETCGYVVGPFGDLSHAVRKWNRSAHEKI